MFKMNELNESITGNVVPSITYFDNVNFIQEEVNRLQVMHILEHGANAVFVLSPTGEGTYFKDLGESYIIERAKLLLTTADAIAEHYQKHSEFHPILVGIYGETASQALQDKIQLLTAADTFFEKYMNEYAYLRKLYRTDHKKTFTEIFVRGLVIPPPRKMQLDSNQLHDFYDQILATIDFPVYMYNDPSSFRENIIKSKIIEPLIKDDSLKGIIDSSDTLDQKLEYLKLQSESFSVLCGKESMIGTFLKKIPIGMRKYSGIVPSLSNLTINPKKILDFGVNGKSDEMIHEETELNKIRNDIYDSYFPRGKTQRGIKLCFRFLYNDLISNISLNVTPEFEREVPEEIIERMIKIIEDCVNKEYIIPIV